MAASEGQPDRTAATEVPTTIMSLAVATTPASISFNFFHLFLHVTRQPPPENKNKE